MGDDEKGEKPMNQPVIRTRERPPQTPVQPVAPAVRIRERPAAPPSPPVRIRVRERPNLQPGNDHEWGPGMKKIIREIDEHNASLPRAVEVPPLMPEQWPNGSAVMRGPHHPGYRRYPHVMGEPEEKNPNLMGRVVSGREVGRQGGVYFWRWQAMRYTYVGRFNNHGEVFASMKR